jgi:subtilase family serine protease
MKIITPSLPQRSIRTCCAAAALLLAAFTVAAQAPAVRIQSEVDSSRLAPIPGSQNALTRVAADLGRMPANTPMSSVTLRFNRSPAQEAALDALIQAQQNPASPLYHQWLTPDQFAARFGMAQSDIEKVEGWLQQQGFAIDSVSRSQTAIRFSGTVGQVESAFATEMHYFQVNGQKHFAPSTALSVPSAIAGVVADVQNLSDFRPHSDHVSPRKAFTSAQSGNVFFAPPDIVTTYDMQPLLSGGVNGAGQTIVIAGQSQVALSDIEAFESASGLTKKDPNIVLVPGTGNSTVSSGDESESDLDLEWSGAMAPGATIDFVYVGSSNTFSTFDAAAYAIDEGLGNIISMSYSICELDPYVTSAYITAEEAIYKQATVQGQTVLSASGDEGSTSCYGDTNLTTTAEQEQLAVAYPASSAYITAVGGTEIASEFSSGGSSVSTYWNSASGNNDLTSSAKSYIPEVAWNDDAANEQYASQSGVPCSETSPCLSSSGGGASTLVAQPSFQTTYFKATGEANPDSSARLVPDIAFYASPGQPGYLYCTSDQSAWGQGQTASCGAGFRASSSDTTLTVAGGTSFGTPIFAGMLALLNQNGKYVSGQGEINATLYGLAANSTIYAADFHDVTTGNNDCLAGSGNCASGNVGYSAVTGYDEVTGLGSLDLAKLASDWAKVAPAAPTLTGTSVSVSAANATPQVNTNDIFTITVSDSSGNPVTTGTVTLQVDVGVCVPSSGVGDTTCGGTTVSNQSLNSSGVVTYTANFSTQGMHTIVAQYCDGTVTSGQCSTTGTHAPSTGVGSVSIPITSSGKGTIAAAASPTTLTLAQGSSGVEAVTITPSGGYTGTVLVNIDFGTSGDNQLSNLCANFSTANLSGLGEVQIGNTQPGSVNLNLDTNAADCTGGAMKPGFVPLRNFMHGHLAKNTPPAPRRSPLPPAMALAGLLFAGFLGRRSRLFRNLVVVLALGVAGMFLSACGGFGGGGGGGIANPPKGTYNGTFTATDSNTSSITATATFTFVID